MRIGLIDVDGHNFPNLPLMKLSAWHKAQGDSVEWYQPMFSGHLDRVYMSKVFSFTHDYEYFVDADEVIKGGSGYCITLTEGGARSLRCIEGQATSLRSRTHLSRLFTISRTDKGYGIWVPDEGMPERMWLLSCSIKGR